LALGVYLHEAMTSETSTNPTTSDLATLRAAAVAAIAARDAIQDCNSPAWAAAHKIALAACYRAAVELARLAKNPTTRYGAWRTPSDIDLMQLGYL